VDHCQRDGSFYCTRFNGPEVLEVTPSGVVISVSGGAIYGANAVKVEDETGNLVVAGLAAPGALPAKLGYVTRTGAVLTSHVISSPADLNPTGIEIKESRKVSGFGLARAGSTYFVNFAFPASPGSSYVAAMSTGLRPGFPLGDGRVINLAVDLLFVLSVGGIPGITTGFTGVLDGTGRATGTITLPPGFPPGIRFYVSALVVNPAAPLGIDSGNSLGVTSN
jgi:hypothetical protein